MKNQIQTIVINYFLESTEFEFKEFNIPVVIEELEPLFKATLEQYLYLRRQNPNNIELPENSFFIISKK